MSTDRRRRTAGMRLVRRAGRLISGIFFQGLAITLPITLTIAVIYWLAVTAEHFLATIVQHLFPGWEYWPGLGILVAIVLVFLSGVLMRVWITRRVMASIEAFLDRIPIVKSIYGSIRDLSNLFSKDKKTGFQQVVAIRISEQVRLVGFLTMEDVSGSPFAGEGSDPIVGVYLPMSYQIGGYTVFLPKSLVEPLDMSVETAMRFTLTAGMSGAKVSDP
jgi:uncharacterized membrane protein